MAKRKDFNISTFVEEASEAATPRSTQKSAQEKVPNNTNQETLSYGYRENSAEKQQTVQIQPEPKVNTIKPQRGRKKSLRTIPRENGKVVFLEVEADAAVARISVLERVDKQDIIRTALDEFLKNHYDGRNLDSKGSKSILEYIIRTTKTE